MLGLDPYVEFGTEFFKVWQKGSRNTRGAIVTAVLLVLSGLVLQMFAQLNIIPERISGPIERTFWIVAALIGLGVLAYGKSLQRSMVADRIQKAEQKAEENPEKAQAAWELAQLKLETYLDRNLSQVRSVSG